MRLSDLPSHIAAIARAQGAEEPRRNKFGNSKTVVDGITFDSRLEANDYAVLKLRERAGEISGLVLQPVYELRGRNGAVVCRYRADFGYVENGRRIAHDSKGVQTRDFRIKAKLFRDNFPNIELRISTRKPRVKPSSVQCLMAGSE